MCNIEIYRGKYEVPCFYRVSIKPLLFVQLLEQKLFNATDAREASDGSPFNSVSAWAIGVRWPVVFVLLYAN